MDFLAFMEAMGSNDIPLIAAFFIGLMTAISPCPAATNIAAISYISRRIDDSRHTVLVGLIYTLGRMISYVLLSSLIVWIGLSSRTISMFLQRYGEAIIGPLLIALGLLMLDVFKINIPHRGERVVRLQKYVADRGFFGGFLLGFFFALSFCPFSALLFFGMLIPLSLASGDAVLLPSVFAIATGLPVILFSFLLTHGARKIGSFVDRMQVIQSWMRRISSIIFICVGVYYSYLIFL